MDLFEHALIVSKKRLRESSLGTYRSWWKKYTERLGTPVAGLAASKPGHEDVAQMMAAIQYEEPEPLNTDVKEGYARAARRPNGVLEYVTQKRMFALVNWVYTTLNERGHPLVNPCTAVAGLFLADDRVEHKALDDTWRDRLTAAATSLASGWKQTRLVALVHLLNDTALKTQEILDIRQSDLVLQIPSVLAVGKGRARRSFELDSATAGHLRAWLRVHPAPDSPYLFVRDASGKSMDASTVWRQLTRVAEASGVKEGEHFGTGAIRASKARELTGLGLSTAEIAAFLGHRDESSTGELLARVR